MESDGTLAVNVSITSSGGWEVPLEFRVVLENYTAVSGQKLPRQQQLHMPSLIFQTGDDYDIMQNSSMILVPAQFPETSYQFELEIMITDDGIEETSETFTVSLDLLTQVGVSNASNLTATVTILDDDGM